MKFGFLITARLKSTRLPQKLLLRLQGVEVIRHVIRKAKEVAGVDEVVLCTSNNPQDEPLVKIAAQEGIAYFIGDPSDVLLRLRDAAKFYKIDSFLSITADNPLFCIDQANQMANLLRMSPTVDYAYMSGLPIGSMLYGLRTKAVDVVCDIKQSSDTEIWGPFINRPDFFEVCELKNTSWDFPARLTLDEPSDYLFQKALLEKASRPLQSLDLGSIEDILRKNPELLTLNSQVKQAALDDGIFKQIENVFLQNERAIKEKIKQSKLIG